MAKLPTKYNPWKLIDRDARRVHRMVTQGMDGDDIRLSEAQMNRGVLEILKAEPLFYLAGLVKRYIDPGSKLQAEPETIRKILVDLHDRMYPAPDYRVRRKGSDDNQFELEFMWATDGEGERVAIAQFEKVDDVKPDRD